MSDTQHSIGTIHSTDLPRDAIHIAVVQIIAAEALDGGNRVVLSADKKSVNKAGDKTATGLADPYLEYIPIGSKFYMFLYPNTVTGLTHNYKHPALDN